MLARIGESVLDIVVGIIVTILEFILMLIAFVLDIIINTFSFIFQDDFMSKLYDALPALSQVDGLMTVMGLGIAILLLMAMLYQMAMGPLLSNKTQPRAYVGLVLARSFTVIPLVICAEKLTLWLSNLFATFYSAMLETYKPQLDGYLGGGGQPFYLTNAIASFMGDNLTDDGLIDTVVGVDNIQQGLGFTESVMETLSGLAGVVITIVLVVLVGWNLLQFFLEIFERFAVMFFIMKVSPLCISTAINPSTQNIATSWLKFFIGQFTLWVLQVMCMGWVIGCLGNPGAFVDSFTNDAFGAHLAWAGICYGLINMSRHVDDYINKLGLTAATTGSDFFRDLNSIASAIGTGQSVAKASKSVAKGVVNGINKGNTMMGSVASSASDKFTKGFEAAKEKDFEAGVSTGNTAKYMAAGIGNVAGSAASAVNEKIKNVPDALKNTASKIADNGAVRAAATTSALVVGGMSLGPAGVAAAAGLTGMVSGARAKAKNGDVVKAAKKEMATKNTIQSMHQLDGSAAGKAKFDTTVEMPKEVAPDKVEKGSFTSTATKTNSAGVVTDAEIIRGQIIPENDMENNQEKSTVTIDHRDTYHQESSDREGKAKFSINNKSNYVTKDISDETGEAYATYQLDKEGNETLKFVQKAHHEGGAASASYDAAKQIISTRSNKRPSEKSHTNSRGKEEGDNKKPDRRKNN